jgi:hypothetical protein
MDQATGEVYLLILECLNHYQKNTVALNMVGGGIARPEQPIKGC